MGAAGDRPAERAPGRRWRRASTPTSRSAATASSCPSWRRWWKRIRSASICSSSSCSPCTDRGARPARSTPTGAALLGYAANSGSSRAARCRSSSRASSGRIRLLTRRARLRPVGRNSRGWKLVLAGAALVLAAAGAAVGVVLTRGGGASLALATTRRRDRRRLERPPRLLDPVGRAEVACRGNHGGRELLGLDPGRLLARADRSEERARPRPSQLAVRRQCPRVARRWTQRLVQRPPSRAHGRFLGQRGRIASR